MTRPLPRKRTGPRPSWEWTREAACKGEDLVLFFGADGERQFERDVRERKARAICSQCPVRTTCNEWAIGAREVGTWAGLNEEERKAERRRRQRRAAEGRAREERGDEDVEVA